MSVEPGGRAKGRGKVRVTRAGTPRRGTGGGGGPVGCGDREKKRVAWLAILDVSQWNQRRAFKTSISG